MTPFTDRFPEYPRQIVEIADQRASHVGLDLKMPLLIVLDFLEVHLAVGCVRSSR
jgi:hypothetical protein